MIECVCPPLFFQIYCSVSLFRPFISMRFLYICIDVRRTAADPLGPLGPSGTPGPRPPILQPFWICPGGKTSVKELLASLLFQNFDHKY